MASEGRLGMSHYTHENQEQTFWELKNCNFRKFDFQYILTSGATPPTYK